MPDPSQPLGRIDVSQLIGQAPPAVNPSAVEQLVDAFHKGFVTTDDIHSRLEQAPVNTAKRQVELQAATEAMTPEAIAARQAQTAAQGMAATEFAGQRATRAAVGEATKAKAEQETEQAKFPFAKAYDVYAATARAKGSQFPEPGTDLALKSNLGWQLTMWDADRKAAAKELEDRFTEDKLSTPAGLVYRPKEKATGAVGPAVDAEVDSLKTRSQAKFKALPLPGTSNVPTEMPYTTPDKPAPMEPIAPLGPPAPESLVSPASTPAVSQPEIKTAPSSVDVAKNIIAAGQGKEKLLPLPPVPTGKPEISPAIGSKSEFGGMFAGPLPPKAEKDMTEAQQRAFFQLTTAQANKPIFDQLSASSFAKTGADAKEIAAMKLYLSTGNLSAFAGSKFASDDAKRYANAANAWILGYLRTVSGAAIAEPELKRYYNSFFANFGDTPEILSDKARARQAVEDTATAIVESTPEWTRYKASHPDQFGPPALPTVAQGAAGTGPAAAAATPYDNIPEYNSPDEGAAATKPGQRYKVKGQKGTWLKH